jgi:SAM-dependent methyltransferase
MIVNNLPRKLRKLFGLGITNLILCVFTRNRYKSLQKKFEFDPWHSKGTYYCRPYQRQAAKLINSVFPNKVVEVGCGLGEILQRVNARQRFGYDIDQNVISAAKYLRGKKIIFRVGTCYDVKETDIDVLVLLNWIHNISPIDLKLMLNDLLPHTKYILVEEIYENEPDYKFYHDFDQIKELSLIASIDGGIGEPRKLKLFQSLKNVF